MGPTTSHWIISVSVVPAVIAGLFGSLAWSSRVVALAGIGGLGVLGALAAGYRLGLGGLLPSLAAAAVGIAALAFLSRTPRRADTSAPGALSRRGLLLGTAAVAAAGEVAGGVGLHSTGRTDRRRMLRCPAVSSAPTIQREQLPPMTPFVPRPQSSTPTDIRPPTSEVEGGPCDRRHGERPWS